MTGRITMSGLTWVGEMQCNAVPATGNSANEDAGLGSAKAQDDGGRGVAPTIESSLRTRGENTCKARFWTWKLACRKEAFLSPLHDRQWSTQVISAGR